MNNRSSLFQEVSLNIIKNIFENALQENIIWEAKLLDGGMFNTTYFVEYGSKHKKAVLRLGPINRHLLMGFEENLMKVEKYVYSVCQGIGIPCSHILACDLSKNVIGRDFMIAEYIPSIAMAKAELTEEKRNTLYFQMGQYLSKLHQVTGETFGFVSRICEGKSFEKWSDALIYEMKDISDRFVRLGGLSAAEAEDLLLKFQQNKELLDEITQPHLLHTDLWEGNVLLDEETLEIVAIIDSDRAMFGDTDFEFASSWMGNSALREGYGSAMQVSVTSDRARRMQLYQMFFSLLEAYVWYGEYNNFELYEKSKRQLMELMDTIGDNLR